MTELPIPSRDEIEALRTRILSGSTTREISSDLNLTDEIVLHYVKIGNCQFPIDQRKYTKHLNQDEVVAFTRWYRNEMCNVTDIMVRFNLGREIAKQWLVELAIKPNSRRLHSRNPAERTWLSGEVQVEDAPRRSIADRFPKEQRTLNKHR